MPTKTERETIIPGLNVSELTPKQALAWAAHGYLAAVGQAAKRLTPQTKEHLMSAYHGWRVEVRATMREADVDNATRDPVLRLLGEGRLPRMLTKRTLIGHQQELFESIMPRIGELLMYAKRTDSRPRPTEPGANIKGADRAVLDYLARCGSTLQTQGEIARGLPKSVSAIKPRLRRLEKAHLIHRPNGARSGYTCTPGTIAQE